VANDVKCHYKTIFSFIYLFNKKRLKIFKSVKNVNNVTRIKKNFIVSTFLEFETVNKLAG